MSRTEATGVGPRAQWAEVYLAEADRLMRLASVLVGPGDAHDLVADTVQRVVRSPGWAAVDRQSAYLYRALVNAATSSKRSAIRREEREVRAGRLAIVQTVDPTSHVDVRRALGRLAPQQRAIVYFTYWEDLAIRHPRLTKPRVGRVVCVAFGTRRVAPGEQAHTPLKFEEPAGPRRPCRRTQRCRSEGRSC